MPVYEYRCNQCRRKVALYFRGFSESSAPTCPGCGSADLNRLFSTFAVRKTYTDTYEDILSDSQLTRGMLNNDPRALAEWNKRMSKGEKVAPEYEDMVEKMERGQMPGNLPDKSSP